MKNCEEAVGIDVSKYTLDAYCYVQGVHQVFSNDISGYRKLIKWANGQAQKLFYCFENTGNYSLKLALYLSSKKLTYVQEIR